MAPLADTDLFTLDSTGSQAVRSRLQAKQGQRRGGGGGLKAAEILSARSNYPALVPAKHARQRAKEALGLDKAEVRRLKSLVKRKERAGQGLHALPDKTPVQGSSAAFDAGGLLDQYDLWSAPSASAASSSSSKGSKLQSSQVKPPPMLRKHELLTEDTAPPSVALPLPGQSYNPAHDAHQELLGSAAQRLQTEEERARETEAVKQQFDAIRQERGSRELWELAEADVAAPLSEGEDDGDDDADLLLEDGKGGAEAGAADNASASEVVRKKQTKPKTAAEKKKRARNIKIQKREHAARLLKKAQNVHLSSIPSLIKELEAQPLINERQKQAHLIALRQRLKREGLPTSAKKNGARESKIDDYQLEEDLSESLRGLKQEGNLWKDWQESQVRRRKMPIVAKDQKFKKDAKTKTKERVDSRLWLERHG